MESLWITAFASFMAFHQMPYAQAEPPPAPIIEEVVEAPVVPAVLERIALCESRARHFNENGEVLRGVNKHDIGKYQINAKYWRELAEKLGHDIYTEEGNEAMALAIYERHGTKPWKWSKHCWSK